MEYLRDFQQELEFEDILDIFFFQDIYIQFINSPNLRKFKFFDIPPVLLVRFISNLNWVPLSEW